MLSSGAPPSGSSGGVSSTPVWRGAAFSIPSASFNGAPRFSPRPAGAMPPASPGSAELSGGSASASGFSARSGKAIPSAASISAGGSMWGSSSSLPNPMLPCCIPRPPVSSSVTSSSAMSTIRATATVPCGASDSASSAADTLIAIADISAALHNTAIPRFRFFVIMVLFSLDWIFGCRRLRLNHPTKATIHARAGKSLEVL